MTVREALNSALDEEMSADPKVFLMGEEVLIVGNRNKHFTFPVLVDLFVYLVFLISLTICLICLFSCLCCRLGKNKVPSRLEMHNEMKRTTSFIL